MSAVGGDCVYQELACDHQHTAQTTKQSAEDGDFQSLAAQAQIGTGNPEAKGSLSHYQPPCTIRSPFDMYLYTGEGDQHSVYGNIHKHLTFPWPFIKTMFDITEACEPQDVCVN